MIVFKYGSGRSQVRKPGSLTLVYGESEFRVHVAALAQVSPGHTALVGLLQDQLPCAQPWPWAVFSLSEEGTTHSARLIQL